MWSLLSAAAFFVGLAIAIKIYNFFEGETLLADCLDEMRLARADIQALDARWALNTNRSDCIVTLTSIPTRLAHLVPTLKSLMRQSRAPKQIVLNLPAFSRREGTAYVVPDFLLGLKSVRIERCEDLGPATKLLPTLARENADQMIIAVDDDRIYPEDLVAGLETAAKRDADSAYGMSGWNVPADLTDRPTTIWSNLFMQAPAPVRALRLRKPMRVDVLQGLSGYLVRPRFFDLARLGDYSDAPAESFFVDDVWISGHCKAPRFVLPARRYNYQPKLKRGFYNATSLGLINRGVGGDASRNNTIVAKHLKASWRAQST
jgi:hypothetical protein